MSIRKFSRTLSIVLMILFCSSFCLADYLTIDPNDYDFLIYENSNNNDIILAMRELGIDEYTLRDADDPVTANDMSNHDILITGWDVSGDFSGLDPNILYGGITGRVILTGHDADHHTVSGREEEEESKRFFSQMINYVLAPSGSTGMISLADAGSAFNWVPSEWDITATDNDGDDIEEFTTEGLASGVYYELDPNDMSGWDKSYHSTFTGFSSDFVSFELGGSGGDENITIARTYFGLGIDKVDDIDTNDCVEPNDIITYTIRCSPGMREETGVTVTDHLPINCDFISADPCTGTHNIFEHTYTWNIGTLDPNDPNEYFELTVRVNGLVEPGSLLINKVEVEGDKSYAYHVEETPICCFGGDTIFVDVYANGSEAGTSWTNAYTDLQDALARARKGCGSEIWVASGVYKPDSTSESVSFELISNVGLYGGFAGYETSRDERDYIANKTYLSGDVGDGSTIIVEADNIADANVLDGFIITGGVDGLFCTNSDLTIANCVIADNFDDGIDASGSDMDIKWSIISGNTGDAIEVIGTCTPAITNCKIKDNGSKGINCGDDPCMIVKNSVIYNNGAEGISLGNMSSEVTIRNCTIVNNANEGIKKSDGTGTEPTITNCILWGSNSGDGFRQLTDGQTTYYSCVYDPNNDPNATSTYTDGNGNITRDPNFAYDYGQFGYYHLDSGSACVDAGYSTGISGEYDIDDDDRIYNAIVDMGADEVVCSDVSNVVDWDADGRVNMVEFGIFSAAWLSQDPNYGDPNFADDWDPRCDLVADYEINIEDYAAFCEEWLWEACWRNSSEQIWMMMAGGGDMAKMLESQSLTIDSREETFLAAKSIPVPQLTFAEQAAIISENLDFLEKIWETEEDIQKQIDEETWDNFIDSLQKELKYLEDQL